MATQVSELHEDVFGFPSSPDQLAVFSPPTSEYDYEYDELAERHLQGGFLKNHENFAQNSRGLKRKQSYSVVPVVEAPRKRFAPEVNGLGNVSLLNGNNGITLSVQTPLSSSRVKSTTPDIDLLFSLFKVLEEEAGEWNSSAPSSSVSSPVGGFEQYPVYVESPSESFDSSSPASSPAAYVPDCDDRFQTQIQIQPQTQDQMFQFQLHLLQLQQLQQFQACGSVVPEVYPTQPAFETVGLLGFADQLN